MGDIERGDAELALQLLDLDPHLHPQLGVDVAERLVEQEHLRVAHDGAPHRHPPALAAGKLRRLALQQLRQFQRVRRRADLTVDLRSRLAPVDQPVGHVAVDGHVRIEGVVLEHHGDVALGRLQPVHPSAVDQQITLGDRLQPGDHAQQRGLAAAWGPDDHDQLAVGDVQIDALHRNDASGVGLAQTLQMYPHYTTVGVVEGGER